MKAKKSLGQNFLIDESIINKIVNSIDATKDDLIIEIGPGRGAITKKLVLKDAYLICYELDEYLDVFLNKFCSSKVKIKYQDILSTNINEDIKNVKYNNLYLVGNLPYYITTPIIEHIINENLGFKSFTIMVQREVAQRFMAKPNTKEYGYMTLILKYYYDIVKVCDVSKNSFNPIPNVESMVIKLVPRDKKIKLDINKYSKFLKDAFKYKRKTLKNNLHNYDLDKFNKFLSDNNLDSNIRAEELSEDLLVKLFNILVL